MADNARIDDLRKRLEKEPGSRLFAQLAEELRKNGDFEEAIAVSRSGLEKQPAYGSARMTLGRALQDSGDLAGAIPEFEVVLKGAADNILASRLLGECLEGVGKLVAAASRYKATLVLAPGDKQVQARLEGVEARLGAAPPPTPVATPAAVAGTPSAPAPVPLDAAPAARAVPPDVPIPLVETEESFELESPYSVAGSPTLPIQRAPQVPATPPAPVAPVPFGLPARELDFEFEAEPAVEPEAVAPPVAATVFEEPPFDPSPVVDPPIVDPPIVDRPIVASPIPTPAFTSPVPQPDPELPASPVFEALPAEPAAEPELEPVPEPEPEAEPAELASSTLAELYFNQGHTEKAIAVYLQLVEREPQNERARARLTELTALESHLRAEEFRGVAAAPLDPRAARRAAIERTIARLEGLLASVRRE